MSARGDRPESLECPTCGLAQTVGVLPRGARAHCARCDTMLLRNRGDGADQSAFCLALTALILLVPANLYPILEVTTFGRTHGYTVLSGAEALWQGTMWPLAIPVALASVVLPAGLIVMLLALATSKQVAFDAGVMRALRRACDLLRTWAIVDVYLLAIFVTVAKLADVTDAKPALGALLFFAMVLALTLALRNLDADASLPRAAARTDSLTRTLALALAALILFVPANLYPTLTVVMWGSSQTATVFGGVVDLWQAGMWPLALIVLCASLVIPFLKIAGLMVLVLTVEMTTRRRTRTRLFQLIEKIGRWSMLDVYVISLFVAVLHFGALADARAEIGSLAFVAVVIVTLMAAQSFDPRLIWAENDARVGLAP